MNRTGLTGNSLVNLLGTHVTDNVCDKSQYAVAYPFSAGPILREIWPQSHPQGVVKLELGAGRQ